MCTECGIISVGPLIRKPMIQASHIKQIDPKALKGVNGKVAEGKASANNDLMNAVDAQLFAAELEANLEVKPVVVNAEQALELPSTLVNPNATSSGNSETVSPKVFDSSLTQDVQNLIQPKTSEVVIPADIQVGANQPALTDAQVLELANAEVLPMDSAKAEMKSEIAQALLKQPQIAQAQTGRAPAIEFAQAEVDPQLLNLEDFVAQKNLATKKNIQGNAYGMKAMPEQKVALENGLKSTEVVTELTKSESSPMNSQQFILNMMTEQKPEATQGTEAPVKVFDMSNIKTSNSSEIVNQITDYMVQAKASKEPTVNMRMKHDELGLIDITVSKTGANHEAIAINIGAHSTEGKIFFQQNTRELFSHLANAGLNVADMKVETPTQSQKQDFDFNQHNRQTAQQGSDKQFGSEQNQRRHDQERRQDLWKLLNGEAA